MDAFQFGQMVKQALGPAQPPMPLLAEKPMAQSGNLWDAVKQQNPTDNVWSPNFMPNMKTTLGNYKYLLNRDRDLGDKPFADSPLFTQESFMRRYPNTPVLPQKMPPPPRGTGMGALNR